MMKENVRLGLVNIVDHAFGNHNKCEQSWCGFAQNPNTYKHSNLPYGKDRQGDELRKDLTNLFQIYAEHASKLAPLESIQSNENCNKMVSAKAPKSRYYPGSNSFNFRASAAVCQQKYWSVVSV